MAAPAPIRHLKYRSFFRIIRCSRQCRLLSGLNPHILACLLRLQPDAVRSAGEERLPGCASSVQLLLDALKRRYRIRQRTAVPVAVYDAAERPDDGDLAKLIRLKRKQSAVILQQNRRLAGSFPGQLSMLRTQDGGLLDRRIRISSLGIELAEPEADAERVAKRLVQVALFQQSFLKSLAQRLLDHDRIVRDAVNAAFLDRTGDRFL
ncbi:hypothetical protein D3C71_1225610 [compost metagenome]